MAVARSTCRSPELEPERHILLVEDHRRVRESLAELLGREDRGVLACATVAEALQALETPGIGLVITDLNLPDGSGMAVVQHALAQDARRPVIVSSAHELSRLPALSAASVHCVRKPFAIDELEALVERLLAPPSDPPEPT